MVGYYRVKELGFRLAAGAHVLPKEQFAPIEAATELLAEARRTADAILDSAKDAFDVELARGFSEGLARARVEAAERLLKEGDLLDRKIAGLEHAITEIVVASVRRLVSEFDDRAKAEAIVRTALKQMRREKKAELRVSPEQYEEMRGAIGGIKADFPEIDLVDVVEDAGLVAPQVIVETAVGRVEGDLGLSLAELERAVRAAATGPATPALPETIEEPSVVRYAAPPPQPALLEAQT